MLRGFLFEKYYIPVVKTLVKKYNARRKLRARLKATAEFCGICGRPLDWTLKDNHDPMYVELDEIIPVSLFSPAEQARACLDPANVQVVHRICNEKKGNKVAFRIERKTVPKANETITTSQEW